MKRTILSLLFLFTTAFIYSASMRDYVCVVRSNLSQETTAFLEDYQNTLDSKGLVTYGKKIEAYLSGTFGSGFIYYAPNGKPYIISNRHVVLNAETATVQFENDDGSYTEYKDLKIVAIDDDIDVAIIELPKEFKKKGLNFRTTPVSDGDEVMSAGFPGLGSDPVWQFGRGNITNANARIKELLSPSISSIIQHSAEVDAGNSGGPLLIKDASQASGYSVVGINTWKAFYRQNTNYAIPAAVIKNYVDKKTSKLSESISFTANLEKFNSIIADKNYDYKALARYISLELTEEKGADAFIEVILRGPSEIRNQVSSVFADNPIEGLRNAVAFKIWSNFYEEDKLLDYKSSEPETLDNTTKVTFTFNEETKLETSWKNESSKWLLIKYGDDDSYAKNKNSKAKKTNKTSASNSTSKTSSNKSKEKHEICLQNPYSLQIFGGPILPLGDDKKIGYTVNLDATFVDFFSVGFFVSGQNLLCATKDSYGFGGIDKNTDVTLFGFSLNGRLPINFGVVTLEPKAGLNFGMGNLFSSNYMVGFLFQFSGGLDCIFKISDGFGLKVGAQYVHSIFNNSHKDGIIASAGICFLENF